MLAFGGEVVVNDCLLRRQPPLPPYRKCPQIFDFGRSAAYNAALSTPRPGRILNERPHGRTFPVQEHHAPQGPAGCPEVKTVRQAGAGNHGRGQDGAARSLDECAVARRHHLRPPGEHVEGLDRARDQEGERQRERELRRDPLRGLWSGRRRRHCRGADRQPQPRGVRHPLLLHQVRRQSRRNRLGCLHVRPYRHYRIRRQGRLRRCDAGCRDRGWRRRRVVERERSRGLCLAGNLSRRRQGAGGEIRRAPQGGADLEAAQHRTGGRREPAKNC